ncbi:THAP domain-containing protein 1-like, partial [Myzus persicae]|uniref:THAP domain-containing protein 1-like n=1 Tax=Myzus persicae TaxID=13164 RepID=UPI000B938371
MVLQCAIKTCKEKSSGKIKMHGIPRSIDMMNKWLKTIRSFQPDFQTTTHTKICSLHFLEDDYNLSVVNNQKVLKKSAIPSVFTKFASMIEEIEVDEIEVEENKVDEIEVEENKVNEIEVQDNKVDEIEVQENKDIDDVPPFEENLPGPSVTDSARKVNKRKFYIGDFKSENDLESPNSRRKLFHAAQTSHKKYQSTIRKLRMQNLNLKKKILNLGQLIDHLKSDNKINESSFSFLK